MEFMSHEIEEKKIEIMHLQQEIGQLRLSGAVHNGNLDEELNNMIMESQTKIDQLKGENLELRNKHIASEKSGEIHKLKKDNKNLKDERDKLKKTIEDLHKKLEYAEGHIRDQR